MPLTGAGERALESLVDQGSVRAVLESLAQICLEKGEHVLETWQDRSLARRWAKAARKVGIVATSPTIDDIS